MKLDMLGEQTEEISQLYSVVEDGQLVNYVHTDSTDSWEKEESGKSVDEIVAQDLDYSWLLEKVEAEEITLEEDTQNLDGKEVYVMSCTLKGEELQKAVNTLGGVTDTLQQSGIENIDFTALTVPTTYYIEKETFLPVKMEMTIEGIGDMLNEVLSDTFSQSGLEDELTMMVGDISLVLDHMAYEFVEVPTVPKKGRIIANQEDFNPDMGDGTYVIQESGDAVKITVPEDWVATEMGYDTVTIQRNDKKSSVIFTMHTNVETGLAFRNYVERGDVLELLRNGNYDSHGSSDLASDYSGMWIKAKDGTNYYYAWTSTGERCFLFVKMTDKGNFDRNLIDSILHVTKEFDLESVL